jgi:hypothetical protein
MLPAVRQKIYPFALGAFLSFALLVHVLLASPVFAGVCAGSTSCG